ncbi:MAG: hypothetical protein ACE5KH_06765 [Candidatus Geothermarchaeales archaeon]
MKISDRYRDMVSNEIAYVRERMKEAETEESKLYYYSAVYGIIGRVMRFEHDPQLLLCHFVLNSTYNLLNQQVAAIKSGAISVRLPEDLFDKLDSALGSFQDHLAAKQDEDLYEDLQSFVVTAWRITGGGFYDEEKLGWFEDRPSPDTQAD